MRTPKQTEASRANGAKSKGPITPEGKRNSSRNSTRHGLLAETIVLEAELAGRFLELLDSLIEEHQPRTPTEAMLVDTIAAARWRQDRIWGMQKVAFDHDIASCDTAEESSPLRAVLTLRISPKASAPTSFCSATRSPSIAKSPDPSSASNSFKPENSNQKARRKHPTPRKTPLRNEPSNLLK